MITTPHLVDYLINNDLETQIASRDYSAIFEAMIDNHPDPDGEDISLEQLKEAVELAREDPYIRDFALPKFESKSE